MQKGIIQMNGRKPLKTIKHKGTASGKILREYCSTFVLFLYQTSTAGHHGSMVGYLRSLI